MRWLQLDVGGAGVLAFLGTGVYMATHFPAAYAGGEHIRYLYRANHVYVLAGSLVNIALGCYWPIVRAGWRGKLALVGASLVAAAPFLLAGVLAQWPNRR